MPDLGIVNHPNQPSFAVVFLILEKPVVCRLDLILKGSGPLEANPVPSFLNLENFPAFLRAVTRAKKNKNTSLSSRDVQISVTLDLHRAGFVCKLNSQCFSKMVAVVWKEQILNFLPRKNPTAKEDQEW